jgi:hypothetical protein
VVIRGGIRLGQLGRVVYILIDVCRGHLEACLDLELVLFVR